jgi:S-adenosylmethionine/arginine decarboxylase-like enzyme
MMRRPHQLTGGEFTFGLELVMDIDNCPIEVISDPGALQRYTAEIVDRIKMTAYGPTWLHHFGHASAVTAGYTAFQPIETSSIIVHVSEGLRRVHVNVFSCRQFDPDDAMDFSEKYFGGTDTTYTILPR